GEDGGGSGHEHRITFHRRRRARGRGRVLLRHPHRRGAPGPERLVVAPHGAVPDARGRRAGLADRARAAGGLGRGRAPRARRVTHAPPPGRARVWSGRLGLLLAGLAVGALTFLLALQVRAGSGGGTTTVAPSGDAVASAPAPDPTTAAPEPEVTETAPPPPLAGLTVAVDPGHNGGNGANPLTVNAPVPDGRGGTKACNTVGASTDAGYPEHAFTWDVAGRLAARLAELGAVVVLTRPDDAGVGPCVDARGRLPQEEGADLLVSLHANGTPDRRAHGFFAIVADPPVHGAQGEPSVALAHDL